MTLAEKVAYLGGGGYEHGDLYSGGNAPIPRLGVPALNMNDGRAGFRVLPAPAPGHRGRAAGARAWPAPCAAGRGQGAGAPHWQAEHEP